MADDAIDSGLFNISLSDSDDGNENGQTSSVTRDRTGQTEEKFQEVKRDFRAKIENGEVSFIFLYFCFLLLPPLTPQ